MSVLSINNNYVQNLLNSNRTFARFVNRFTEATQRHKPEALVFSKASLSFMESYVTTVPEVKDLPRYQIRDIEPVFIPRFPDQNKFTFDDSKELNHSAYWLALEKYRAELNAYFKKLSSGTFLRGILISKHSFPLVLFSSQFPDNTGIQIINAA